LVFYVKQTISVHSSMSSLADAPDLVGFFSYSREDDEGSGGRLSKLRERIQEELRGQLGRTKRDFRLWQDKVAIAHGELWEDTIKKGISESVFFIPIITPTAVKSRFCKFEFETFLAREKELGRSNLVFPILYIPIPALADDRWHQDPLLAIIGSRQYEQWQNLRQLDPSSTEVALRVEKFCENICKALQQPWLSPQERQEAETRRRTEEERRREEAQTKRRLDEAEAEKRRQDKERRKLEKEAAWAAKKERLHRWRGAAAGAAVVALLMVGVIWLYRTTTPVGVTSTVVQPVASGADKAKDAAEAAAQRKAEEAEQQRIAAAKAEEERKAKAAAEAEAQRKAAEAEQQRLAAAKAEEERKAKAAAAAEAQRKAEKAEQQRLATVKAEEERRKQAQAEARTRYSALVNQGNTDINSGDYDRAIATFSEAIRLDPNGELAFTDRGMAYRRKGDYDRAIADYTEAIRLNPNDAVAFVRRGYAYWSKRDYDRAIADFDEAIQLNPNDAVALANRANAYWSKGDNARAIADEPLRITTRPFDSILSTLSLFVTGDMRS
jgi:tetratricopeptide (TPR) repeat protein